MRSRSRLTQIALLSFLLIGAMGLLTVWSTTENQTAVAQAQGDTWATTWSEKLGLSLVAEFDSSGPPAWDMQAHPLVFITTVGPGYSGQLSKTNTQPGVAIIDANTYEVVASAFFELDGVTEYREPHGLGVSADGKWLYLPTGPGTSSSGANMVIMIIDAYTLKLNKIVKTPTHNHHTKTFTNSQGKDLVLGYGFSQGNYYTFDPSDNNRVVGGILNADTGGRAYLGFVDRTGKYLFATVRPNSGLESEGWVSIIDTETWKLVRTIGVEDSSPIWVAFTADNNTAYVSGGHESIVIKIDKSDPDPAKWKEVGTSRAGTEGPYGIHLNWEETQIWTIGKGEGSHNLGITIGLVDPARFVEGATARPLAEYYTGCVRADHGTVNPNPDVSELWITCNSSFETIVFDMDAKAVTQRIPMPNGGSTHSGSFVQYIANAAGEFEGEVLNDQNGFRGSALETQKEILGVP